MDTLKIAYWIFEYALVMAGYLLLFFVWPHIVFASHLSGKSPIYRMGFCFSVQTVLISSLVLLLGFLHILNPWTMRIILYGVPVAVLLRKFSKMEIDSASFFHIVLISRAKVLVKRFQTAYAAKFREMWKTSIRPYIWEYLVLALLLIYNLIYLSWGPFQTKCYSLPDQYVHHSWLYGLTQGQIFSGGVYPSAMHCLLYAIHCLLGVKTRMLILFFGSIQGVAILLAFYCLMRELFRWRWVPLLALTMISLCGNGTELGLKSMVRLQGTLPLEFAMMFQFFCVLFLLRYLKSSQKPCGRGKLSGLILGNDLLVFTMCVAATVSVHFHPAVTTVFMCLGIAPFYFRRVFSRERLLPLVAAVLAGVLAALLPMAIAWASGIPLNGSFGWGLKVIQNLEEDEGDKGDEEFQLQIEQEPDSDAETNIISKVVNTAAFVVQMIYLGHLSLARGHQYKAYVIVMFGAMGVSLLMKWLLARRPRLLERLKQYGISQISFDGYVTLAILSIAVVLLGISSDLGLPSLTTTDRIFVTERMLLLLLCQRRAYTVNSGHTNIHQRSICQCISLPKYTRFPFQHSTVNQFHHKRKPDCKNRHNDKVFGEQRLQLHFRHSCQFISMYRFHRNSLPVTVKNTFSRVGSQEWTAAAWFPSSHPDSRSISSAVCFSTCSSPFSNSTL